MASGRQIELIAASALTTVQLTRLWNDAFSDYYVPMQLTPDRFAALVRKELISLPDSFVAMVEGRAVGFALAGLRRQGGRLLGYDAGTAVTADYRQQGIARCLMQAMLLRLQALGVEQVTLTAVADNSKAIALYRQLGFVVVRQLTCWELPLEKKAPFVPLQGLELLQVPATDVIAMYSDCYRRAPEWQNRPAGGKLQSTQAVLARWKGEPVGYTLFAGRDPLYLYQLGVLPQWRRRGIGRLLLRAVLANGTGKRMVYLNHPEEEVEAAAWLQAAGFSIFLQQVEMVLSM